MKTRPTRPQRAKDQLIATTPRWKMPSASPTQASTEPLVCAGDPKTAIITDLLFVIVRKLVPLATNAQMFTFST